MNNKKARFRKKLIASAVASVVASMVGVASAQTQNVPVTEEELVVTGIRASLNRAMDIRRDSKGIVDAISAEDIGKMPDTNLAESLQRITGVSIDREGGEGNKITVRGLGPDFNLVTFNGRTVARTSGSRSFDFANVAAEMVSSVIVEKTGDASNFSGGMGATVDIRTSRPLDRPGMNFVASAKAIKDSSSNEGGVTPEVVALFSNTFADDTMGMAVSLSYQERDNGQRRAEVGTTWRAFDARQDQDWSGADDAYPVWGGVPDDGQINRPTEAGEFYAVPQTIGYFFTEEQRKRLNGNLVFQWSPREELTATFDYSRFEREVATQRNDVSAWFTFAPSRNVFNNATVATPIIYSELYDTPQDLSMAASNFGNRWTTDLYGANVAWEVNDRLSFEADVTHSKAKRTADSPYGSSNVISTAAFIRTSASGDFTTDIPTLAVGNGNSVTPADMQLTGSVMGNSQDFQEVDQIQLHGNFALTDEHSIDFGVSYTNVWNHSQSVNVQRNDWGGVGDFDLQADAIFGERETIIDQFDGSFGDFSEATQLAHGGTLEDGTVLNNGSGSNDQLNSYFDWDFELGRQYAIDQLGVAADRLSPSSNFDIGDGAYDRQTTEETTALYLQYNYISDYGLTAQVGLRYEETEVESTSRIAAYDGAVWIADTEIELTPAGVSSLTDTGSYDHVLPNLNLSYEINEGLIARFAYSTTIARPHYNDIKGGTILGNLANQEGGGGSAGNPNLKPFESDNLDLSLEWYYDDASYLSFGYFQKEITNFISTTNVRENVFGIRNPARGDKRDAAVAAIGTGDGGQVRQYIFDNFADDPLVDPVEERITGGPTDELMLFNIATPTNGGQDQKLEGFEFNVQHMLGETGFGGILNYTIVNTDLEYDTAYCVEDEAQGICLLDDQEALIGVSDSANLVLFYEKDAIAVRFAYNWRDEFLSSRFRDGPTPIFVDPYGQLDFNASYTVNDQWEVYLQGINVTEESRRTFGRDDRQTHEYMETGAIWSFGTRFTF